MSDQNVSLTRALLKLVQTQSEHFITRVDTLARERAAPDTPSARVLARVLRLVEREVRRETVEWLARNEPELATALDTELYDFEQIVGMDDRSVQVVLREIEAPPLAMALKGASDELKDKIFRNMSPRAVTSLKKDMDDMGPVRLEDCEGAQHGIEDVIRDLAARGAITVPPASLTH